MKATLAFLACLLVLAVAVSPADFRGARFASKRRRDSIAVIGPFPKAAQLDCANWVPPPAAGAWEPLVDALYQAAPKDEPRIAYAKGKGYSYNNLAYDNTNGKPIAGKAIALADLDLCKLYPQTICSQGVIGAKLPASPNAKAWPKNNFCQSHDAAGKMCCPFNGIAPPTLGGGLLAVAAANRPATKGCPAESKVAGMPRSFMPQIIPPKGAGRFLDYLIAKGAIKPDAKPKLAVVPMNIIAPTQDEMFLANSVQKICSPKVAPPKNMVALANPTGTAGYFAKPAPPGTYTASPLDICGFGLDRADLHYILDGHHRYSQKALCPAVKDCDYHAADPAHGGPINPYVGPPAAPDQAKAAANIFVNIWPASCRDIVRLCLDVMDYTAGVDPRGGGDPGQLSEALDLQGAPKGFSAEAKNAGVATGIYFKAGAFVELESRFGRSRHTTSAQAAAAYVRETRARLEEIGVELKGGDEALEQYFEQKHAPMLWQ